MAKLSDRDRERVADFVVEMTEQRKCRSWSQSDLADRAHVSKSLIGAVEVFERAPSRVLARALDQAFGLPGTFGRLYAKTGRQFPAAFASFAAYERAATSLLIWECNMMPGLVQTEDYAEGTLSNHPGVTPDQVAERVSARLSRQPVLTRTDTPPPMTWILLDEQVLDREVGGPDVMAAQLARLIDTAALPNVTVQIVPRPSGGHPGLLGTFNVAERRGSDSVAFIEGADDGRITDDPATIDELMLKWRYLGSLALPAPMSLELIKEKRDRWTTEPGGRARTAVPTAAHA